MKKLFMLIIASALLTFVTGSARAETITKLAITMEEPVVGQIRSFKTSLVETSKVEVTRTIWYGTFNQGAFIQGNDYSFTVKLQIKDNIPDIFAASLQMNVTINGRKAEVTSTTQKTLAAKITWTSLGGEKIRTPEDDLESELKALAAAYSATNATSEQDILQYLRGKLPKAEIWSAGGPYTSSKVLPSATSDGNFSMTIGIVHNGIRIDRHHFSVVLPALNKSVDATQLNSDMALMKAALKNMTVTSKTTGADVIAAMNAAAQHGTKASWENNKFDYTAPTSTLQGSIQGNIILALGGKKDVIAAIKVLPINGSASDAAIDADFSALSKALDNYPVSNNTSVEELVALAYTSIKNGSKLTVTGYSRTPATYESEGKIVLSFGLELNGAKRIPRITIKISKVKANIPAGISLNHDEWELLRHSNIQRHNNGLCCVAMIAPLQDACDLRAPELATDFRLDHHRPDGSEFRTAVNPTYIAPDFCMENGHAGSFYPSQAVKSWMNSPKHRGNILTPDHCYFGAGVYHTGGDSKYWVQWFVRGNDIKSIETSTGSDVFKTIYDMEEEYLVCYTKRGIKAYVPLDATCMTKDGNQYTIQLQGISYTVTVLNDKR